MSATTIIEEIRKLPRAEQVDVAGDVLANASNEEFQAVVRKRRTAALHKLFAHFDGIDHVGKNMTEEEIVAIALEGDE